MSITTIFKENEAKTQEEKLIVEFVRNLKETTTIFVNLNKSTCSPQEVFNSVRIGMLAYAAQTIDMLLDQLSLKEQKPVFINDCTEIFDKYMKQTKDKLK